MPATVPMSWRYFDQAAAVTFGGVRLHGHVVGLHLYHVRPGDQFGPLAIAVAQTLREVGGTHVVMLARVVLPAAGLGVVWLVADAAARTDAGGALVSRSGFLLAAGVFLYEWDHLALYSLHIDDAIALVCTAVAVDAIARRSDWWWAAIAIGAAAAAKPWAITFLPVLAALQVGRRRIAAALAVFIGLGVWAPFVLADPKTLLAAHYTIPNEPSSVLRLFGVHARRTPRWDRLAQLLGALGLGVVAVARRRWQGVVVVAVAVRIMLDPSVRAYYATGLVFGAMIWDLLRPQWRWPYLTISAALLLELSTAWAGTPTPAALLRLLAVAGAIAVVLVVPAPGDTPPASEVRLHDVAADNARL